MVDPGEYRKVPRLRSQETGFERLAGIVLRSSLVTAIDFDDKQAAGFR